MIFCIIPTFSSKNLFAFPLPFFFSSECFTSDNQMPLLLTTEIWTLEVNKVPPRRTKVITVSGLYSMEIDSVPLGFQ